MSVEPHPASPDDGAAAASAAERLGPVTDEVRALLARLGDRPVAEHAEVFADIHGVLQNALSDAGRDPAPR